MEILNLDSLEARARERLDPMLFDYIAGRVPRAPRWLADNGLEWIFRLAIEPHRMWRRYLLGNPAFLWMVAEEARARRRNGGAR